ncbi:hypothetical protein [Flammeovirga sp. SJP92]|uniref:hypothetical protein n=1 Tax=Flammeovirga sp. SJP92 TaxID=1775430 RepID=UPI00078827E6|nr:hypothetical protein [Flammeovirga sp. SJP92]KXX67455.1 hypothetical protein AVL50_29555 [Flammeovirga sp. SJP92]
MLKKEKCIQAIQKWAETKSDFSKVNKLIDPTKGFRFDKSDREWLKKNNDNSQFHIYAGVHDDKFILILVPLDKEGAEVQLDKYLTKKLSHLKYDITLVEKEVVTTVSKTRLSKSLEIEKFWQEVDYPVINEPSITEKASAKDIEQWKYNCLDWFYYECTTFKGKYIFNAFTVPYADLESGDEDQDDVVALFGFKKSFIYQKHLPILIFIATNHKEGNPIEVRTGKILKVNSDQTSTLPVNTLDWVHPCPPLCKDRPTYGFL